MSNGFTGIDTANQPKHYQEDLVGEGLRKALAQKSLQRADIYVQTKFTAIGGQDVSKVPYDPRSSIVEQVRQSIASSLNHFDVSSIDGSDSAESYLNTVVLHSPMSNVNDTMEVWRTLESFVPDKIRNLGISNCNLFELVDIFERARVKPAVVQNRFYASTKYDVGVRRFCQDKGIVYQSFWTLSANPALLRSKPVAELASKLSVSRESALYCLVIGLGNTVVLNGTTKQQHMQDDWSALSLASRFAEEQPSAWEATMTMFKKTNRTKKRG